MFFSLTLLLFSPPHIIITALFCLPWFTSSFVSLHNHGTGQTRFSCYLLNAQRDQAYIFFFNFLLLKSCIWNQKWKPQGTEWQTVLNTNVGKEFPHYFLFFCLGERNILPCSLEVIALSSRGKRKSFNLLRENSSSLISVMNNDNSSPTVHSHFEE